MKVRIARRFEEGRHDELMLDDPRGPAALEPSSGATPALNLPASQSSDKTALNSHMCRHSPSSSRRPPRDVGVVLCHLGHCCGDSSGVRAAELGDVWFTWQLPAASTLVVLQSSDAGTLGPLIHAVNDCAYRDGIRVRTRSVDDRGRALTFVTSSLPPARPTPGDPAGKLVAPAMSGAVIRTHPTHASFDSPIGRRPVASSTH